jgi:hypothetical protein
MTAKRPPDDFLTAGRNDRRAAAREHVRHAISSILTVTLKIL